MRTGVHGHDPGRIIDVQGLRLVHQIEPLLRVLLNARSINQLVELRVGVVVPVSRTL